MSPRLASRFALAARNLRLWASGASSSSTTDVTCCSKAFCSGAPHSAHPAPSSQSIFSEIARLGSTRAIWGHVATGCLGTFMGAGGTWYLTSGKFPDVPTWFAASSIAPRQQQGWTQEQVQRKEAELPASAAPTTVPGLGPHFIADAAAKAAPAVVNVTVKPAPGAFFPSTTSGSGFIMQSDGLVVTNAHVIADALDDRAPATEPTRNSRPVIVSLPDGRSFEGAIAALDRVSDIALVKIEAKDVLPVAELGRSAGLRAGEWILALGSPLSLHNTVTAGIVSCTERKAVELGLAPSAAEFIQLDVAVNQGNSGGPIVNLWGQVVGISNMSALTTNGISFAIPIDAAKAVIRQLEEAGRVRRPHVGMKLLELNAAKIAQLRARDASFPSVAAGILVPAVTPGSPAAAAGLQAGDIITGFAGGNLQRHELTTSGLVRALGEHVGQAMQATQPASG
ncbi:hypothetical protein WJX73_006407 [Symbiochloris irregularis]|uniref:PDZ domain-containing protein n=1 Tax=Symbiochloris irregularis TaxID=706552 RepID=A0AAW1PE18_9CHLO